MILFWWHCRSYPERLGFLKPKFPDKFFREIANMELCTVILPSGERCMNVGDDHRAAGRCIALHRHPKWAAEGRFVIGRSGGAVAVNATFADLCETDTPAQPYKRRIQHILSEGEVTTGAELVHGIMCKHLTQKSNNCTVWFSWNSKVLTIWGLGKHAGGNGAGNSSYTMTWCDGTNKTWTRSA